MSERSNCSTSFGNVKISDLDFTDDAVIFAETLEILLGALEVLNEESEPLGFPFSWVKTQIQAFNDILDVVILLTSAIEDGRRLLVSPLSVCLFVNSITEKLLDGFRRNLVGGLGMVQGSCH